MLGRFREPCWVARRQQCIVNSGSESTWALFSTHLDISCLLDTKSTDFGSIFGAKLDWKIHQNLIQKGINKNDASPFVTYPLLIFLQLRHARGRVPSSSPRCGERCIFQAPTTSRAIFLTFWILNRIADYGPCGCQLGSMLPPTLNCYSRSQNYFAGSS